MANMLYKTLHEFMKLSAVEIVVQNVAILLHNRFAAGLSGTNSLHTTYIVVEQIPDNLPTHTKLLQHVRTFLVWSLILNSP